jgi:galactokinase/mevalonate kinase-like predicted kinase
VRKVIKKDMPALEHYVKFYWEMKKEIERKLAEAPIPPLMPPGSS